MNKAEGITGIGINHFAWGCLSQSMMTIGIMVGINLIMGGSLGEPFLALGIFSVLWIFNSLLFFQIQWEFKRMEERVEALESRLATANPQPLRESSPGAPTGTL